ncbi:MAG TPA: glycosyl hydrolase [Saprospiraceae bacterium]|nr:glycosyl hydrolase [Saprospiraceae bacterium]HMQ84967.1 glycosyl hydrolase [Saprospiraceae bacterium]
MKKLFLLCLALLLVATSHSQNTDLLKEPNAFFQPLKWRSIGPFRGGRSVAACGVVADPLTYYMGTTGGGLWKTEDAGQIWNNISDGFFKTGSVGAVAVAESDPNIVYCGMGEHAIRGVMTSHGDGVYKSTDAGKTWTRMGLELTQHIARIIIHPRNPDILYVAAQGPLYSASPERGLYKSTDGGRNWKKVLSVDDKTGCADISMDRNNPLVLYAAMWEHGRLPWKVISGGPGSGLYKSVDGGETWEKIHEGLPNELGKMAIAVSPANSNKVYAVIESDSEKGQGGLFVSENGGKNWTRISDDHRLVQRAWYYIEVFADPWNENMVYVLSAEALRSIDGGQTWETLSGPHGDYHDLWINPNNPKNLVIADDGGAGISFNRGETWSTQYNMPTAQMYRVNADNLFPYRLYGGQQDNSSVVIANRELNSDGIYEQSWTYSAGGESAFLAFDPDNPRYVLGGSYLGTIEILDTKAQGGTNIMAAPIQYLARDASDMKYRFNWNAPIMWSQHEPNTYYHCAQLVLKTQDMGSSWQEISPDLTRNEKAKQGKGGGPYTNEAVGAENYGTISYILESPHEKGVIWVGSDDGLVHLTRDGGANWQNVTPAGLSECLVNAIEVSPHDPGTVYIATTRYKFNDHTPAIYKTTDYGKTWTNISKGIPYGAFTRVVREDTRRKDLLFAGTETGVYASWNGGKEWKQLQLNLPVVPVTDLMVKHDDLVAATAGRSYWILDDLEPLRQWKGQGNGFHLFQPEVAFLSNGSSELDDHSPEFKGSHPKRGVNPANGVVIYYHLPNLEDTTAITLEIKNANGRLIRAFSSEPVEGFEPWDGGPDEEPLLSKQPGLNRFVWNMRHQTMVGIPGTYYEANFGGHKASPGVYTLILKRGNQELVSSCQIAPNPLYGIDLKTYEAYDQLMGEMEQTFSDMHRMVNQLYDVQGQLSELLEQLPETEKYVKVQILGQQLLQKMKAWDEDMVQRKSIAYDDVENFPNKFTAEYIFLINQAESHLPRITKPVLERRQELEVQWQVLKARAEEILKEDIPAFNQVLWNEGVGALR